VIGGVTALVAAAAASSADSPYTKGDADALLQAFGSGG
jgi:hypothetical protein